MYVVIREGGNEERSRTTTSLQCHVRGRAMGP